MDYNRNYSYNIPQFPPPVQQPMNVTPTKQEKKNIRKLYNGIGIAMLWQYALVYILVFLAYYIFSGFLTENYTADEVPIIGFAEATIMFCMPAISSIIMFFFYNTRRKINIREMFRTDGFDMSFIVKAVAITFLFHQLGMFLQYGVAIVLAVLNLDIPNLNFELANDVPTTAIDLFSSIILAPIAEELFFRGVVLKSFAKVSQRFAIIISAVAFGLMHGNPYQAVMATLVGLVLGYVTIRSNSLIPAIICHMAMNFMASVSSFAYTINDYLYEPVYFITSAIELAVGVIGIVYVLKYNGIKIPPYTNYHKQRTMPIIMTSAAVLISFAIYIYDVVSCCEPIEEAAEFIETTVRMFIRI